MTFMEDRYKLRERLQKVPVDELFNSVKLLKISYATLNSLCDISVQFHRLHLIF
jgi:hypothetical protein